MSSQLSKTSVCHSVDGCCGKLISDSTFFDIGVATRMCYPSTPWSSYIVNKSNDKNISFFESAYVQHRECFDLHVFEKCKIHLFLQVLPRNTQKVKNDISVQKTPILVKTVHFFGRKVIFGDLLDFF